MDKVYWINKSGESVDIDTMDVNHLRNTLKMIVRARLQAANDKLLKKYPVIPKKSFMSSWDNEEFMKDLKATKDSNLE